MRLIGTAEVDGGAIRFIPYKMKDNEVILVRDYDVDGMLDEALVVDKNGVRCWAWAVFSDGITIFDHKTQQHYDNFIKDHFSRKEKE
ncbi:hypothetical protein LCGC14_1927240 [marine sediment metagenome]|uniref:Uncharacterized protein n=1 Tax=marine sediment metagenome TaxID=412755 RepID=A0A0F9FNZ4_9ZZZZ